MRIIKRSMLVKYGQWNPQAQSALMRWHKVAKAARWACLQDVRDSFAHADPVRVKSGRTVVVFNVSGNRYRLITAIHYNRQMIFTLIVLTHAEYDRGVWKEVL